MEYFTLKNSYGIPAGKTTRVTNLGKKRQSLYVLTPKIYYSVSMAVHKLLKMFSISPIPFTTVSLPWA